jgi:opacity protein-like surface antigen
MLLLAFTDMKGFLAAVVLILAAVKPALAQGPLMRGDVSGTLGWLAAATGDYDYYDDWHSSLLGELGAGWYWSNHAKLEISGGATKERTVYGSVTFEQNGQRHYGPSRQRFSTRRLSIAQLYQMGDNQWFHPYVGAGIDVVWERTSRRDEAIFTYDINARQNRLLRNPVEFPPTTDVAVVPAASAGFKAYLTQRSFFRSDLRVGFSHGPNDVALRFGFGIDF